MPSSSDRKLSGEVEATTRSGVTIKAPNGAGLRRAKLIVKCKRIEVCRQHGPPVLRDVGLKDVAGGDVFGACVRRRPCSRSAPIVRLPCARGASRRANSAPGRAGLHAIAQPFRAFVRAAATFAADPPPAAGGDDEGAAVHDIEGDADIVEPEIDFRACRPSAFRLGQTFEQPPGFVGEKAARAAG